MKKKIIALILCMSVTSILSLSFAGDPIEPVMESWSVQYDYLLFESNNK